MLVNKFFLTRVQLAHIEDHMAFLRKGAGQ